MTAPADNDLWQSLQTFLFGMGASVVGCGSMLQVPDSNRDGLPIGISIAVALEPGLIESLLNGPSQEFVDHCSIVRASLGTLRKSCVQFLSEHGHRACFSRSAVTNQADFRSDLPHKTVATRAGLGWIGKCAVLISKDFGGALRLTSVLTDAPLPVARPIDASICGSCDACVVRCPGRAVIGKQWQIGLDRAQMFDPDACVKARAERCRSAGLSELTYCDVCIAVCPFTKRYVKRMNSQQLDRTRLR